MASILTVDDSLSIRTVLGGTLRRAGYQVVEASHGGEALELARSRHFDLVFTDVQMPVMDGLTLIRSLRAIGSYTAVPIVVLTTSTDPGQRQTARMAGASGWMVKPFSPDALLEVVKKVLPKRDE